MSFAMVETSKDSNTQESFSMTIYTDTTIPPTVLYIKQHSVTKLKYFGKTTQDPLKYKGSGVHWSRHLKKHGKEHIITIWVSEPFIDSIIISEFALAFSRDNNIVESKDWANQKPENGLDGWVPGVKRGHGPTGPRGKQQNPSAREPRGPTGPQQNPHGPTGPRGKQQNPHGPRGPASDKSNQKNSDSKKGVPKSDKHKQNMRKPKRTVKCPYCNKTGGTGAMHRWHFDNCKKKPVDQ